MTENRYLKTASAIPTGQTRAFFELAAMAGRPGAARAVGRVIRRCGPGDSVPWHRVVAADGSFPGDPERGREQLRRLRREGARPGARERVDTWARRVGAPLVGIYGRRVFVPVGDGREGEWDPLRVEPLASESEALARGFRPLDAPHAASAPFPEPAHGQRPAGGEQAAHAVSRRLSQLDWDTLHESLAFRGYARLNGLLSPAQCETLRRVAGAPERFERTVDMTAQGFGIGAYHYFREPLAEPAASLRARLYEHLQPVANAHPWRGGRGARYPERLEDFWQRCRQAGQRRGSCILLCYGQGGINHPHRDIYGPEWFPFQAMLMLSCRDRDFGGGELELVEERTDGDHRYPLEVTEGDVLLFGSRSRLERTKTTRKVALRHGMQRVTWGRRFAMGIVFHLAR